MNPSLITVGRAMPIEEEFYTPPTDWYNDHPDPCKDCLHRGTVKGMDYARPYCQFYHTVLKKNTLDGDCKYRSTKVGE